MKDGLSPTSASETAAPHYIHDHTHVLFLGTSETLQELFQEPTSGTLSGTCFRHLTFSSTTIKALRTLRALPDPVPESTSATSTRGHPRTPSLRILRALRLACLPTMVWKSLQASIVILVSS